MRFFLRIGIALSGFLFFGLLGLGCKSVSDLPGFETVLFAQGKPDTPGSVDETKLRQFDFYFLEANRLKMLGDFGASALSYMEALKLDSTSAVCYFEIGNLLIKNGEFQDAEQFLFEAVRYSPGNPHYLSLLSRLYLHQDKKELALQSVRFLNKMHPGNADYLFQQAEIEAELERFDDVLHSFSLVESIIGIQDFLSLEKHAVYLQKNDLKGARIELERLIEHYPSQGSFRLYLADFYLQNGKPEMALSIYKQVTDSFPGNGQVHFSLANYYLSQNLVSEFKTELFTGFSHPNVPFDLKMQRVLPFLMAIEEEDAPLSVEELEKVVKLVRDIHPYELQAHILSVNFYQHTQDSLAARESLETALLIDESNQELWQDYLILLFGEDTKDRFLEESLKASSLFPDNGLFHYFTGYGFLFNEDEKSAVSSFETALPLLADNTTLQSQIYGLMGDLYFQLKEPDKAFSAYNSSLALDKDNVVVLNNYAYYLSIMDRNLVKAEKMISRVIELEGNNPTYLDTYAWVLFKRGQYLDALYFMEQALANDADNSAVLHEHYGDILFKVGNLEMALEQWNRALELGTDVSSVLEEKIREKRYIPEVFDYE